MSSSAKLPAKHNPFKAVEGFDHVTITIGAEAANAITVSCQLQDTQRRTLAGKRAFQFWLADAASGLTLATAPSGGYAIASSKGLILPQTANRCSQGVSDANGEFAITITDTGTPTFYLVIVKPNGELVISDAITFA